MMNTVRYLLEHNPPIDFWFVVALAIGLFLVFVQIRRQLRTRALSLARLSSYKWAEAVVDMLGVTRTWMLAAWAILIASSNLEMPAGTSAMLSRVVMALLFLQIGLWAGRGVTFWLNYRMEARAAANDTESMASMAIVGFIIRVALWSVILILVLDHLGFDVTALVASLGIGGVAVALAVQNILGDLFASLSIALDKPFVIGDFIIVGDVLGTVEHVGLKTTRIRSLGGEQIVMSNADMLSSRIRNYKRMAQRRIVFEFGVTYDTPVDKLERIAGWVREIVEAQPDVRFDRAHFRNFGDSSLMFETVFFVLTADYNRYMDTQQAINLALVRRFEAERIGFAFPTRTLHMASVPADLDAVLRTVAKAGSTGERQEPPDGERRPTQAPAAASPDRQS